MRILNVICITAIAVNIRIVLQQQCKHIILQLKVEPVLFGINDSSFSWYNYTFMSW